MHGALTLVRRLLTSGGKPWRFVVAGLVNTAFGLTLYPLLLWLVPPLRVHYLVGLGIAQATSLVFAFCTYKLSVFRTRANVLREFGAFASFYLVHYAVNWAALPLLVEAAHVPPIIAQVGFSLVLMITSYFWHSLITFRPLRDT